jgi:hypothetical protein
MRKKEPQNLEIVVAATNMMEVHLGVLKRE